MPRTRYLVRSLCVCVIVLLILQSNVFGQDKKLGRHTVSEWRAIIDSTWGAGPPTATKLGIFDSFWNSIDQQYGGFPYLDINMWDSLKVRYRPQVEAGVSRGRFAAIMGQLVLSLQDIHAWAFDQGISPPGYYGLGTNSQYFTYEPGNPMFWTSGWGPCGVFGAAVTPLPDSSLVVYKTIDAHPLGLKPGDVIVGYDGISWKQLYKELLAAELPIAFSMGKWGTTPRSMTHALLGSAGNNWGLFNTVDIAKYATGDTLHLATAPLTGLPWNALFGTEQLAIPGVETPNFWTGRIVTSGVVLGTSIGYVYVWGWLAEHGPQFRAALEDLLRKKKVTGLILDFRYNLGSGDSDHSPDAGFDLLFNETPAGYYAWRHAMRNFGSDHFSFRYEAPFDQNVVMKADYYERPIAVLTGPAAWSMGDMHSFQLRSHPMVRFFGLPTNGAFCVPGTIPVIDGPGGGVWKSSFSPGQMYSLVNEEGFLEHKGFPVDEEVWLTRDGVAKGEDDVVNRALAWITTVPHAHDVTLDRYSARPGEDSVSVRAVLANRLGHEVRLTGFLKNAEGVMLDTMRLYNDGLHGDLFSGDSIWGARILAPDTEGTFSVYVQAEDLTEGPSRRRSDTKRFSTAGPVVLDSVAFVNDASTGSCTVRPYVRNLGSSAPFQGLSIRLSCTDPWVTGQYPQQYTFSEIPAGARVASPGVFELYCDAFPDTANLHFEFRMDDQAFGETDFTWVVEPAEDVEGENPLPTAYALRQNYPNPFNPQTTIRYSVPYRSHIRLTVYNTLGQHVATLVNADMDPGYHSVQFDGSGLASGVYFYRLQAGTFADTKKLLLIR